MIIDSHLHVWSDDEGRYPFGGPGRPDQSATVELLNATMAGAGVQHAVIVQPIYYTFDNRYVSDCLRTFPGKFAGVGLVNPTAPDAPDRLEALVDEHGFCGIRLHLNRYGDPSGLAARDKDPLWRRAQDLGSCITFFGSPESHLAMEPILRRFPGVKVVIDHLGGVPPTDNPLDPPLSGLLNLARHPNVFIKVSNVGSRSREPYPHRDAFPVVRRVLDAFGPPRMMWGTDFHHVLRTCGYSGALELVRKHMDFLTEEDRSWILWRTARKVWKFGA